MPVMQKNITGTSNPYTTGFVHGLFELEPV